jgi:hypothetical protein
MHPVVCVQYPKWGRLHNNDIYRMTIKIDINLSTFVFIIIYYTQMLHYVFRPYLGHHQVNHKNIVTCRPLVRQRFDKHFPAETYRGKIGRPFLGSGVVYTPSNCRGTMFSVGFTSRLCKGYRTKSNES